MTVSKNYEKKFVHNSFTSLMASSSIRFGAELPPSTTQIIFDIFEYFFSQYQILPVFVSFELPLDNNDHELDKFKEKLETQLQRPLSGMKSYNTKCIICMDRSTEVMLFCKHSYCKSCLLKCLDQNITKCPVCRDRYIDKPCFSRPFPKPKSIPSTKKKTVN